MKKHIAFTVLFAMFFICVTPLASQEFVSGIGTEYKFLKKWELDAEIQMRSITEEAKSETWLFQGGLTYDLSKRFKISSSYRYSTTKTNDDILNDNFELNDKNRYTFDLSYQTKRFNNNLKVSNRLRYQYSERDDGKNKTYLRNKLLFGYKFQKNIKSYIALEPCLNLENGELKHTRLYLGQKFKINRTTLDLFLTTEAEIEDKTVDLYYILGVTACFEI